jgi:hypothetical protein
VYAVRAISPLLVALVLLVVVVLRQPLPSKGFSDFDTEDSSSTDSDTQLPGSEKDVHASADTAAAAPKSVQFETGVEMGDKDCASTDFAATHMGDVEQRPDQVSLGIQHKISRYSHIAQLSKGCTSAP